jgi:hypothetical protein
MKHISYGLLESTIKSLSSSSIIEILTGMSCDHQHERLIYEQAWEGNKIEPLILLSEKYAIQGEFRFMREFHQKCIADKKFHLLPLPAFSTDGEDFKGVVEKITRKRFKPGFVKKFGEPTNQYGVVFLNNVFYLDQLFIDLDLNLDKVVVLDHSKAISPRVIEPMLKLQFILTHYPLPRVLALIASANENYIIDTARMVKSSSLTSDEISSCLPRKPKSFTEIHDAISFFLLKEIKRNLPLNQDIAYLNKEVLFDYVIEVPSESFDLINTSAELKHCVHGYIESVRRKEVQIINLLRDHKRVYTIELRKTGSVYSIVQFKGLLNENSMERSAGEKYRNEILKMIRERSD